MKDTMYKYSTLFIFIVNYGFSQYQEHYFISPGIKLGYSFGENGGFTYGFETSFIIMEKKYSEVKYLYGFVLTYDWISDYSRLHIGLEYMKGMGGIEGGPTFAWKENKTYLGFSVIPFVRFLVGPYCNYTHLNNDTSIVEVGTYLKLPLDAGPGKYAWWRGDDGRD